MCFTRQKLYTCGCLSVPRKEVCINAARTWPTVCAEPELKPPHASHFSCYSCIRAEVMAEKEAEKEAAEKEKAQKEMEMEAQAKRAEEALEHVEKRDSQKSGGRAWGKGTWGKGSGKGGGKKLDGGA